MYQELERVGGRQTLEASNDRTDCTREGWCELSAEGSAMEMRLNDKY